MVPASVTYKLIMAIKGSELAIKNSHHTLYISYMYSANYILSPKTNYKVCK